LIKKVYFPRLLVPVASVAPALIDAGVYACLLIVSAAYYLLHDGRLYVRFGPAVLVALLSAALSVLFAIAIGLWTSVWQTRFRELRFTMRYFIRFWHYLTPVLYPLSQVPEKYRWLIFVNPLAAIVESFKWGILGVGELPIRALGASIVLVMASLASGIWYFTAVEGASVDRM
jgi:lipopolysaccharide transport system permease protein